MGSEGASKLDLFIILIARFARSQDDEDWFYKWMPKQYCSNEDKDKSYCSIKFVNWF